MRSIPVETLMVLLENFAENVMLKLLHDADGKHVNGIIVLCVVIVLLHNNPLSEHHSSCVTDKEAVKAVGFLN
jgi:hypothetical protein